VQFLKCPYLLELAIHHLGRLNDTGRSATDDSLEVRSEEVTVPACVYLAVLSANHTRGLAQTLPVGVCDLPKGDLWVGGPAPGLGGDG